MPKDNEIDSTEKLLNVIRSNDDGLNNTGNEKDTVAAPPQAKKSKLSLFPRNNILNVGVILGTKDMKMVKLKTIPGKLPELLEYKSYDVEKEVFANRPKFVSLLKSSLTDFVGVDREAANIWTVISTAKVEMRYIKIPKVPKNEISNAIYWTAKKEFSFDDKKTIFDFDLLGDINEDGFKKIESMVYSVPREEVKEIRGVFSQAGFPVDGISIVPCAIQNFIRTRFSGDDDSNICSLYIGSRWSRIDIFSSGNLVLTRDIKTGLRSMIEPFAKDIQDIIEAEPLEFDESGEIKLDIVDDDSALTMSVEDAEAIFFALIHGQPLPEKYSDLDINEKQMFDLITPALDRLVRQVERTLGHYVHLFKRSPVSKIWLSGKISDYTRMIDHFGYQLDITSLSFKDIIGEFSDNVLLFAESTSHIASFRDKIDNIGDEFDLDSDLSQFEEELPFISEIKKSGQAKESFLPAVGLALSNNEMTPNFIFTYKKKDNLELVAKLNKTVMLAFVFIMVLCFGCYGFLDYKAGQKNETIMQLEKQLDGFSPRIDENLVLGLSAQVNKKRKALKVFGSRYKGLAVINELTRLTPDNIKLKSAFANFGGITLPDENSKDKAVKFKQILKLSGIVSGDRLSLEPELSNYISGLEKSLLFGKIIKRTKTIEQPLEQGNLDENLVFTLEMEIIQDGES